MLKKLSEEKKEKLVKNKISISFENILYIFERLKLINLKILNYV